MPPVLPGEDVTQARREADVIAQSLRSGLREIAARRLREEADSSGSSESN